MQLKKLSYTADIRNLCCHDKNKEPTISEINELVDNTR